MKKKRREERRQRRKTEYLLRCPICKKKMWYHSARQHREQNHPSVPLNTFEQMIILAIQAGQIIPKTFEVQRKAKMTSATNVLTKAGRLGIKGSGRIVSVGGVG